MLIFKSSLEEKIAGYFAIVKKQRNVKDGIKGLLVYRPVVKNNHAHLRNGHYWMTVNYAHGPRDDLSEVDLQTLLFSEAALPPGNQRTKNSSSISISAKYFHPRARSSDVFDQTKNQADLRGGYFISFSQALPKRPASKAHG